jgi:hypothetical protein
MIDKQVAKNFLQNRDDTGRFIVTSERTGRTYFVEAIGDPHIAWGSINPGETKLMNKKGHDKYRGSVDEKDSLITNENGFTKIHELEVGMSPHAYIDMLDAKYPDKELSV